jgi:hypothetical protein
VSSANGGTGGRLFSVIQFHIDDLLPVNLLGSLVSALTRKSKLSHVNGATDKARVLIS